MLKLSGIQYQVGKQPILRDINACFRPGELSVVLGQNGSGKTSLLRVCSGEIKNYGGHVLYDDRNLDQIPGKELSRYRAVLRQQPELGFPLDVEEVVAMGRYPHYQHRPSGKDKKICHDVASLLNLQNLLLRNYLTLSGGEQQRVQFARVLAQVWEMPREGKRYLLLDEPLNNLDIAYQHEFLQVAGRLKNEKTVIVAVLHDINLAAQYADRLYFLKNGQLVAEGSPTTVLTEQTLENVFGIRPLIIPHPVSGHPIVSWL